MTARDLRVRQGLVALIGVAFGVSAAATGLFETAVWRPVALVVFAITLGLVVATRKLPGRLALGAVGGLVAVWLWAWISVGWAESASRAETMAGRWALHAAILGALVLIVRDPRVRGAGLAALGVPVLCIAGWVLYRFVAGSGASLFVGGQLTSPMGYSNADATFFLLGAWPLVALAESRRVALSAAAVAALTAVGALTALAQSRGSLVAFLVSALVLLALVPDRRRRLWALVAAGGGVALLGVGLDVLSPSISATGLPREHDLREAGLAILGVSAAVGAAWLAVVAAVGTFARGRGDSDRAVARVSSIALTVLAVAGVVGLAVNAGRISDRLSSEYRDFVHLKAKPDNSTLLGGGPNQYDYWRIALNEFSDAPLKGIGAGDYQRDYFRERRTNEDVRQPHSLVFQTLAELGLVGMLGLVLFVAAVLAGLARTARRAGSARADRRVAVGAGGAFVVWIAHAALDWTWLFPGIVGMALLAAALLLAEPLDDADTPAAGVAASSEAEPQGRLARPARAAVVGAVAVAITFVAIGTARQIAAQHYRAQARSALADDPVWALERTSRALGLHDEDVNTRYVRAAAFARLGEFKVARSQLRQALALEPHAWVTWALIGDLELRHGNVDGAQDAYRRALALNPRDQGLAQASANPLTSAPALRSEGLHGG